MFPKFSVGTDQARNRVRGRHGIYRQRDINIENFCLEYGLATCKTFKGVQSKLNRTLHGWTDQSLTFFLCFIEYSYFFPFMIASFTYEPCL